MTTVRHPWTSPTRPQHPAPGAVETCACGQDLDTHHGRCCPRCGTALRRR